MKKWIILLAAVLVLLAGCGKEPTITGLSNEEFHQYFAEDYARPVNNITEIAEENDGWMLKTDLYALITAMKDGTVASGPRMLAGTTATAKWCWCSRRTATCCMPIAPRWR